MTTRTALIRHPSSKRDPVFPKVVAGEFSSADDVGDEPDGVAGGDFQADECPFVGDALGADEAHARFRDLARPDCDLARGAFRRCRKADRRYRSEGASQMSSAVGVMVRQSRIDAIERIESAVGGPVLGFRVTIEGHRGHGSSANGDAMANHTIRSCDAVPRKQPSRK